MSPTMYEKQVKVEERPVAATRPQPPRTVAIYCGELFSDCLLESAHQPNRRRGWATAFSVVLQGILLCVALLVPLMYTDALPKQQLMAMLVAPPPPPPPPPPAQELPRKVVPVATDIVGGQLRSPTHIPSKIAMIKEEEPPPAVSSVGVIGGVPGGIPGGQIGGVLGGVIGAGSNASLPKPAAAEPVKRLRVSQGVSKGQLIKQVEPFYPAIARAAHVSGAVVMTAIISKDGNIEGLKVISGHPLLVKAAMDAVTQWKYKPFLLNGEPVEVETTVTINFTLSS
jgi:protein TonB